MARILLADDDRATRDLARRTLEAAGHSVTVTEDGNEALQRLAEEPDGYDLLLTDVQMPVLDGIRLADRAVTIVPGIRVLLMSGYGEQLDRAKDVRADVVGTLLKPFTLGALRDEVRSILAR